MLKDSKLPPISYNYLKNYSCKVLSGVGDMLVQHLRALGIDNLQDLILHLPSRYQDKSKITPIAELKADAYAQVEGIILKTRPSFGKKPGFICRIQDESGEIDLRFFQLHPKQRQQFINGTRIRCYGEVKLLKNLELLHPEYQLLEPNENPPLTQTLSPIYPSGTGLTSKRIAKLVNQVLEKYLDEHANLLPQALLEQYQLWPFQQAMTYLHQPPIAAELNLIETGKHPAQTSLIFEELLAQQLKFLNTRKKLQQFITYQVTENKILQEKLIKSLPYELTKAQQRVVSDINQDLMQDKVMLRLIIGDVGCGKTLVAVLAMLRIVESGQQAALMVPTEVLAKQHYHNIKALLALTVDSSYSSLSAKADNPVNLSKLSRFSAFAENDDEREHTNIEERIVYLTGSLDQETYAKNLAAIENGFAQIIIGTHALFQDKVKFNKLALVIVDEQHRFGVKQRLALLQKGKQDNKVPHMLSMSATPIPRTLALSAYAEMDLSIIDELPKGRQAIKTIALAEKQRAKVIERIQSLMTQGQQAYWICPFVSESLVLECQAAENTYASLQAALPNCRIGLVHGRLGQEQKDQVMQAFKEYELDILVATTVVEVGVDVPNASLIVIENAERMGLAQLHQLRGRVGRGALQSFCILLHSSPLTETAHERLNIMREQQDGFAIAEADLALRGPGEVLGLKQSGSMNFKIANLARDQHLLVKVKAAAQNLMAQDNACAETVIKRWLGD